MTGDDINERIAQWLYIMPTVLGYHHPDSRRASLAGFPDWVFIGEHGILYRECKGHGDTLSVDQRRVGRLIMHAGGDWMVWGPGDIINGNAQRELERIA